MKKLFIIAGSLFVVFLIFLVAYNIAFKKSSGGPLGGIIENSNNGLSGKEKEGSASGKIKPISEEAVAGFFLDKKNEKINYYVLSDGKVWQTDLDGEKKKNISNNELIGLGSVLWSPDGGRVISVFGQGGWQKSFVLQEESGSSKLGDGTDAVAWDNLGTKIIYKYFDAVTENQSISVANPDGGDWKKIADTELEDVAIAPIPKTSLVSFWNEGNSQEATDLLVVGMNGGEVKKAFSGKFGADYKWSPDGEKAVVSHLVNQGKSGMTTGIIDINGTYSELGIPTVVSKMEWSLDSKHIYYALPSIPEGAIMPDDYKTGKFKTTDTFWKINTENGEKTRLIELKEINGAYDASQLTLDSSEDALFFANKADGKIYKLDF